jgi:hypothetical protein
VTIIADRGGINPAHLPGCLIHTSRRSRAARAWAAIAKNIVEGLGGTIGVNSAPGICTEIRISLPAGLSG